jgi:hypothetical protein
LLCNFLDSVHSGYDPTFLEFTRGGSNAIKAHS